MENNEKTLSIKEIPNFDRFKRYLGAGVCLLAALLAVFLLIQHSGYKKAEAKFQEEIQKLNEKIDSKDMEIIRLKDELAVAKQVDVAVIKEQVNSINELATAKYKYTNAGQFKNSKKLLGFDIAITQKTFILKYSGVIKAGFDITDPDVRVDKNENTITVTLPPAKILSHEVDFKNAEVLDEKNGLFNRISVADVNEFYAQNKDAMDTRAIESNLTDEALANAKVLIENLLKANPAVQSNNYKVKVEANENIK